jgi:secreted PhoX family phosphatase
MEVEPLLSRGHDGGWDGSFRFDPIVPITGDAACLDRGMVVQDPTDQPLQLPVGFRQRIIARQSDFPHTNPEVNFDMLTLNETGPRAKRFLYRTHEVEPFAGLSVTDLRTGVSSLVVERADWTAFDGLVWTPWGTILMAEEEIVVSAGTADPDYPDIRRGLVYEFNPRTGKVVARPAVGARSHEGLMFDKRGNLYGISESRGIAQAGGDGQSGAIFKFVPKRKGDLRSGQLHALRVLSGRTGPAEWVPIDLDATFDSDAAAQAVGATGWDRPEDIQIARVRGDEVLYVAVTEHSPVSPGNAGLVLKIVLDGDDAYVSNYVEPGVNVPFESGNGFDGDAGIGFSNPDNLALHPNGDLYIAEDNEPGDVYVARGSGAQASEVVPFARVLDCGAEPTGIYFDESGSTLWLNSQHAALNGGEDLTIEVTARRSHHWDDED